MSNYTSAPPCRDSTATAWTSQQSVSRGWCPAARCWRVWTSLPAFLTMTTSACKHWMLIFNVMCRPRCMTCSPPWLLSFLGGWYYHRVILLLMKAVDHPCLLLLLNPRILECSQPVFKLLTLYRWERYCLYRAGRDIKSELIALILQQV